MPTAATTPTVTGANSHRTTIRVDGMTCGACAQHIVNAIERLDAVHEAQVNFAWGKATAFHDGTLTKASLQDAVKQAGYMPVEDTAVIPTKNTDADARTVENTATITNEDTNAVNISTRISKFSNRIGRSIANEHVKFVLAAAASIPVAAVSMLPTLRFPGWTWFSLCAATFVVFVLGARFHLIAIKNLRKPLATMETLVSIATASAWIWSTVVLLADTELADHHLYFETSMVIVTFVLLGQWMQTRSTRRSREALQALANMASITARLTDGRELAADELNVGAQFVVRPGERIATDGVVVEGESTVDASMVTGESKLVDVSPSDTVTGATINTYGVLVVEATRVGKDTVLAQTVRLVEAAQQGKANVQRLADKVASVFVPIVIMVAAATLAGWLLLGGTASEAFTAAVAVLIISCPCALGLATPLAVIVGTVRAAQLGVIIKGADILEQTRDIDTVLLDKTGTVTEGSLKVVEHLTTADQLMLPHTPSAAHTTHEPSMQISWFALAAALEDKSEHAIGKAIAKHSPMHTTASPNTITTADITVHTTPHADTTVTDFRNYPGLGVTGTVNGFNISVGKRQLFEHIPTHVEQAVLEAENADCTVVLVGRDANAEAVISLADSIKPTSVEAVKSLRDMRLHVTLITGDNAHVAEAVGSHIHADKVIAGVTPTEKAAVVSELQQRGMRVAMVGDGINDAPALAQADLGIAMSTGADVAMEASDITIVGRDIRVVPDAIRLAKHIFGTIKTNLFWAFAYNTAAIPLAILGVLSPMPAAAAMSLSSTLVVLNSLRLYRFEPVHP